MKKIILERLYENSILEVLFLRELFKLSHTNMTTIFVFCFYSVMFPILEFYRYFQSIRFRHSRLGL